MKNISKIKLIIFTFIGITGLKFQEVYSSATILKCSGEVPKGAPCLIKATSYKVKVSKIDICKKNPFPKVRTTPDYAGSYCLNLFDKKKNSRNINLLNNPIFNLPNNSNISGEFRYISVTFRNEFTISGKYRSGNNMWLTNRKGPNKLTKSSNNNGSPKKFTEKLTNWRGSKDKDNKYCDNNGGTYSRCDLNYNGKKLTAIGLDKDFVESFGNKVKYVFYNLELSPPISISANETGFIDIKLQKNLEVYGNGKGVQSISTAPILFKVKYVKKAL